MKVASPEQSIDREMIWDVLKAKWPSSLALLGAWVHLTRAYLSVKEPE